ncbi:uncharacterized protein PHALS_14280 [Plasmopara halstedii]|uniref:RxLR-like protein n=1 Tax=Plasmopara halstedii TaxID=4781 RepID=A0A0P1ASJ9_PLAHL|nr:uncharacterized protein PHALS_14280 [Plasmopara halstedii]CEG44007.1 hypothetical protein PHALS_14280 [Plasmopara halstedii]|eukprot:XP_024580376.1 hypothetical protein PHALS_14280 [Plasmopara halstedii]
MHVISILLMVIASTCYCVSPTKNPNNMDMIEDAYSADANNDHNARFLTSAKPIPTSLIDNEIKANKRLPKAIKLWRDFKSFKWLKGWKKRPTSMFKDEYLEEIEKISPLS